MTPSWFQYSFEAIGTRWVIDIPGLGTKYSKESDELISNIRKIITQFDISFSRFRQDSMVSSMKRNSGEFVFPSYSQKLFSIYKTIYQISKGKVTPLIGQTLEDMGYDHTYSLRPKGNISIPKDFLKEITIKDNVLYTHSPLSLDFGGIGKGFLVDLVFEEIAKKGYKSFTVDAGGDIRYKGDKHLVVGLENPEKPEEVIASVNIKNSAICGSSYSRRKWGKYHHIVDPHKAESVKDIKSVWAISDSAAIADAMTSALFHCNPNDLKTFYKFEYLVLYSDNTVKYSKDFNPQFFN